MADEENNEFVYIQDPYGRPVKTKKDDADILLQADYNPLTPEQEQDVKLKEQYGTVGQEYLTSLESALRVPTLGTSTYPEKKLGELTGIKALSPEAIDAREKINRTAANVGEVGAVFAGGLSSLGKKAAVGLGTLAETGVGKLGLKIPAKIVETVARIGTPAVEGYVDNAILSTGHEVSKAIVKNADLKDVARDVEASMPNIGLDALLGFGAGAAFGVVPMLWEAKRAPEVATVLGGVRDRLGGIPSETPDIAQKLARDAGLDIEAELMPLFQDNKLGQTMAKKLEQTDTTWAGRTFQEKKDLLFSSMGDNIVESLGKTPEEITAIKSGLSPYETSKEVFDTFKKELNTKFSPTTKKWENLKNTFKETSLIDAQKGKIEEDLSKIIKEKGYTDTDKQWHAIDEEIKNSKKYKNLQDVQKRQSVLLENARGRNATGAEYDIINALRNNEDDILESAFAQKNALSPEDLGKLTPEKLAEYETLMNSAKEARSAYSADQSLRQSLDYRLKLPDYYTGAKNFINAIENFEKPELLLKRLSDTKNDVELMELLNQFPETKNAIQQYQLNQYLKSAAKTASPNEIINTNEIVKLYNSATPEQKEFLFNPETRAKIEATGKLLERYKNLKHNFSNTARTADALLNNLPDSAIAAATMVMGGNPLTALGAAQLGKLVGKEAPDAVRLAYLKYLGTDKALSATGFKSMVDYLDVALKASKVVQGAVKGVFKKGVQIIPHHLIPDEKKNEKLNKRLQELQADPNALFDVGGKINYYLPNHGMNLSRVAVMASNYLNSIRPMPKQLSPLDKKVEPSKYEKDLFNNALSIANQPLMVLEKVQNGTINSEDIKHLSNMYPSLYEDLQQKVSHELIDMVHKDAEIPYQTRMGLSLFLGQPLDSTMMPASIMALQPGMAQQQQQAPMQAQAGQQAPVQGRSLKNINKLSVQALTPGQARMVEKQVGK